MGVVGGQVVDGEVYAQFVVPPPRTLEQEREASTAKALGLPHDDVTALPSLPQALPSLPLPDDKTMANDP